MGGLAVGGWKVICMVLVVALATPALADKRVVCRSLALRDGPGTTARVVTSMVVGTRVELLEVYQGWGLIKLPRGMIGWARASGLAQPGATVVRAARARPRINEVEKYTSVVWPPSGNLNLRDGPGTRHPVTTVMARGDIVEVFQKSGKWAHVRCITGETGWTYAAYLSR